MSPREAMQLVDALALVEIELTSRRTLHGDAVAYSDGLLILEDARGDEMAVPIEDIRRCEEIDA